jgi:hypothetical protein
VLVRYNSFMLGFSSLFFSHHCTIFIDLFKVQQVLFLHLQVYAAIPHVDDDPMSTITALREDTVTTSFSFVSTAGCESASWNGDIMK